jgi:hypothetical protein
MSPVRTIAAGKSTLVVFSRIATADALRGSIRPIRGIEFYAFRGLLVMSRRELGLAARTVPESRK